jgi:hypothetical protein
MPMQIEWCSRCSAAIYDVDDVPGACGCPDGQLRGLLAMRRIAAGTPAPQPVASPPPVVTPSWDTIQVAVQKAVRAAVQAPARAPLVTPIATPIAPTSGLPDLTPDILMSGNALAEYQAMRSGVIPSSSQAPVRGRRGDEPVEVSWDDNGEDAPPVTGALEELWLGRAEMEQIASSGVDIEFSTPDEYEAPSRPRYSEAARFRVDRPPPRAPTPTGPRVGGVVRQDGEVVGSRQALRQTAASAPPSLREIRQRAREGVVSPPQEVRVAVRTAPVRTAPARTVPAEPPPMSAYERIINGQGPLDD